MKAENWMMCGGLSILLLIGLGIMALGARNLRYAFASRGWPTTSATVQRSEVAQSTSRDSRTQNVSVSHSAIITFEYQVDGRSYTTDTIHFGQTVGSGDSSEAELRRLRYPMGAKTTVAYNPNDPSIAVVHPGFHSDVIWLPGAGLAFFLPGVMAILLYLEGVEVLASRGLGWRIFAVLFALIGVAMFLPGLRSLLRARSSESWPTTPGTIVYSKGESSTSVHHDDDDSSHAVTTYSGRLIYKYDVGGRTYFSNNRRWGQLSGADEDWAAEILARYPKGENVPVAYNPADPQMAVLEPGITGEAYWLPGAGAAFLLFGLAVFFFLPVYKRRLRAAPG